MRFIDGITPDTNTLFIGVRMWNNSGVCTGDICLVPKDNIYNGGTGYSILSTYTGGSVASVAATITPILEAFIGEVGFPWVMLGDVSTMSTNQYSVIPVVVNLETLTMPFRDSGTGIYINAVIYGGPSQPSTAGYAPYANFSAANTALLELLGDYTTW